ncbi:MAG: hypothetical protein ILM98_09260 [Kiritimatiellae bacterium]|nr:hypothetical protein [Kiritimatiellia bacterium]
MKNELAIQGIESIAQTGPIEPGLVLIVGDPSLPRLECAFALGRKIAEIDGGESMALWSWLPSLALGEVQLVDASWRECHRWTLPLRALAAESQPGTAWAGDYPDAFLTRDVADGLNGQATPGIRRLLDGIRHGVAVLDIRYHLDFDGLRDLNAAAKDCGTTAIVHNTLYNTQLEPYPLDSYAQLALKICVEQGVNLGECATKIVVFENEKYGTGYKVRVLD